MLDIETKRRIDTARDILVGKVPDPKSQVEQITIALIYKFMDDMDAESEELGGKRKFFAGEFSRYGWAKLMRSGLGGFETLNLYAEAIAKMPENPGVPTLFRDIFKNAYLPYRDPETLRSFLKIIDEFEYDHSERLGDAFEYLLSVLGSQGDAGQFRTPRHIIDFMVAVIDPQKHEKVLDPACGTAGFLISSYKHIAKANTGADGYSSLSPDDRDRMASNFKGYDISPDMVRLSLVNMYLHGFNDPHIFEYDTLTSQERWNEYADIILANPPFMSPKGGIRPHKRFTLESSRSEVLFVDYMAEHLTPGGRAGIIVPEGIIFKSQKAYKDLREMLVKDHLVAVISLPAGVFNPYSGVKTSILILDRSVAKHASSIALFKIENDGFNLGAQRRPIEQNDLPQAEAEISEYLRRLRTHESMEGFQPKLGLIVDKAKIAADGEYNLSGDRYQENLVRQTRWPMSALSELCEFRSGLWKGEKEPLRSVKILRNTNFTRNGFLDLTDVAQHPVETRQLESRLLQYGDILLEKSGGGPSQPVGRVAMFSLQDGEYSFSNFTTRIRVFDERADPFYVWLCLNHLYQTGVTEKLQKQTSGIRNLDNRAYQQLRIPLPPVKVQEEIVAEIEGYQKVIDGARAVLDNYRPHIPIHPDWPVVELGQAIEGKPKNGYSGKPVDRVTDLRVLTLSATTSGVLDLSKYKYLDEDIPLDAHCRCQKGDIYLQRGNTAELVGTAALFDVDSPNYIYPDLMIRIRADETKVISNYLLIALQSKSARDFLKRNAVGAAGSMPKINQSIVERVPIPLPPLAIQQALVSEVEAEKVLVAANRELIARFEKKIQDTLSRVWGGGKHALADV